MEHEGRKLYTFPECKGLEQRDSPSNSWDTDEWDMMMQAICEVCGLKELNWDLILCDNIDTVYIPLLPKFTSWNKTGPQVDLDTMIKIINGAEAEEMGMVQLSDGITYMTLWWD